MKFLSIVCLSLLASFNVFAEGNAPVEKPFSIGFGYYGNTISVDDASYTDDDLSGTAFTIGYSISDAAALRASFFSIEHDDFSAIESTGYDLAIHFGRGFASQGGKFYIGGGLFKDEWEVGGFSTTFDGLQLSGGVGYNWETIAIDFIIAIRDASDYEDFVNDTLFSNVSATAVSTMLSVSVRF